MGKSLSSKVILITGATGGIGEAAARAFHAAGASLALSGRNLTKLQELAEALPGSLILPADLSNTEEAQSLVMKCAQHFQRLDILINNAASIIVTPALAENEKDLLHAFHSNVLGPLALIREAIPLMKANDGGVIINVGSPGFMIGIPYYLPYVCSKAAFSALTRTLQAENTENNISICEYFPAYVKTPNKPESRVGDVSQDLIMSDNNNIFTRPQHPKTIGKQLIKLALHPKTLTYSSFSARMGAHLAQFSGFRLKLARGMASNARTKIGTNQIIK